MAAKGEPVILVRTETSPEDIHGMKAAAGILTARGGMTSHAAVVARGMGKSCVVGAGEIAVDDAQKRDPFPGTEGRRGRLAHARRHDRRGHSRQARRRSSSEVLQVGARGDDQARAARRCHRAFTLHPGVGRRAAPPRRPRQRRHADRRAHRASFGAEGIGLCRTEHMFFEAERIIAVREMILAETSSSGGARAREDPADAARGLRRLFRVMDGLPVTIRLLDPPLHEFLPHDDETMPKIATELGVPVEKVRRRSHELTEANPMLGHRGCRLGITYPEIYEMQVRAIGEAAALAVAARASQSNPEIMIPLVGARASSSACATLVDEAAKKRHRRVGPAIPYTIGTMIELPRACVLADRIAEHADFFSFGTNDLTQTTFGLSRDDMGRFLPAYIDEGILPDDPFAALDQTASARWSSSASARGREVKPEAQGRHLRRARRRPELGRVLPPGGLRLRVVLAVPRADRPPRGGRAALARREERRASSTRIGVQAC